MFEILFWASALIMAYSFAGYPVLIGMLSSIRPRPVKKGSFTPPVTVIVIAKDEEKNIGAKIENLLGMDYPPRKMKIIVASDASVDRTEDIVRSFSERGVALFRADESKGKPAILNMLIPEIDDEFVVLSDARQKWNKESLRMMMSNFTDPDVGAVSGELVIENEDEGTFTEGVAFYWRYEKYLRKCEAAYDSTCGTTGAIYAIRRELFGKIPEDTLLDDFVIPMNVVKRGKRVVFEESAVAFDHPADSSRHEMWRKIRTLSGNYQAYVRFPWLFLPWKNRVVFQFVSHKALRLAVPFLMLALFFANACLLDRDIYAVFFGMQVVFYLLALLSVRLKTRLLSPIKAFVFLNVIAFIALPVYLSGRQKVTWK
ncbi:MAG: glycosyltransferase family 2 protein [Deltaproteobacteria bacterium]|nr:glycosyltransferase family 2 protein [Deltaproteobacteria bacterium]